MRNENDFYMPPEWITHERTFVEWPVKGSLIYPENYEKIKQNYADVILAISEFEPVTLIVNENSVKEAQVLCGDKPEFLVISHNDAWFRDNGPTFLMNNKGERSAVNWQFNAWGEKYLPYDLDNQVAPKLLNYYKTPYVSSSIILEGGSIHVDGEGTLLTTKQCLLNTNRNPSFSQTDIEKELKLRLNLEKIIWLEHGLYGDETDGHVDNVACFSRPGVILIQICNDPEDPNYQITLQNLNILKNTSDAKHRKLEIIQIPQPPARYYNGKRLTLSYLNFYFINGGILLPVFGGDAESSDAAALTILQNVFPDRKVIPVNTASLITEGGNIHCITQQMPNSVF